jgi:hypothetical protein
MVAIMHASEHRGRGQGGSASFQISVKTQRDQKAVDDCRAVIEMSGLPPISINATPTLTHS